MNDPNKPADAPVKSGIAQKWLAAILVLTFAFVLMPFLLWYMTTFSRPLSDNDIAAYFTDSIHPRRAQHALSQVADRIMSTDPLRRASAKQWYPQVVQLAEHGGDELRVTSAWVMGQDNQSPEFHAALLRMLDDSNPMVQRNAALSLVRFADSSGHDVIVNMLKPYTMNAPYAGTLTIRLKPGDEINPGTLLAHIAAAGQSAEVRSDVPGTIDRWIAAENAQMQAEPLVPHQTKPGDGLGGATRALPDRAKERSGGSNGLRPRCQRGSAGPAAASRSHRAINQCACQYRPPHATESINISSETSRSDERFMERVLRATSPITPTLLPAQSCFRECERNALRETRREDSRFRIRIQPRAPCRLRPRDSPQGTRRPDLCWCTACIRCKAGIDDNAAKWSMIVVWSPVHAIRHRANTIPRKPANRNIRCSTH